MYFNYFKIVLRQLRSVYSLINLIGLIIGFAAFLLIYLWVMEELSYDRFHQNPDHIFRVVENQLDEKGELYPLALTPGPLGPYLKNTFAEVNQTCRLSHVEFLLRHKELFFYQKGITADPSFFDVFSFPMVQGDAQSIRTGVDKIIISEKLATAYFGTEDPIGKVFIVVGRDLQVTGIMKNIPANTHLQFDYVIPFDFLEAAGYGKPDAWMRHAYHTYLSLNPAESISEFEAKIQNSIIKHVPESTTEIALQPLTNIHLKSGYLHNDMPGRGNIQYVMIFSAIALVILVIASINYANLATARSMKRAKEVGVRKVVGASRLQLIGHFFSEALLYSVFAFLVAMVIAWIALPSFNDLTGKQLVFDIFAPAILLPLIAAVIFCALLGGSYPALLLSALNPATVLKGVTKSGRVPIFFRRGLVVFQFLVTISFINGTLLVQQQLDFIQSRNLGFEKENVLNFSTNRKLRQQYPAFKSELLKVKGVNQVTAANSKLSFSDQWTAEVGWEGKDPNLEILFYQLAVDHDFIKTFSIPIADGRDFDIAMTSDSTAVLLNEEAVRKMGLSDPTSKSITMQNRKGNIIGVVKDFNFKSAHKSIEPLIIYIDPPSYYEISVKLSAGNLMEQVKDIEALFKKFNPDRPIDYTFLDEEINKLYRNEQRTSKIFKYFSVLSIFISCLGLLGIVMFVAEQRAKEIALRKVMGASTPHILWLLSKESVVLVVVAFVFATPIMYYLSTLWLQNFSYKTEIEMWMFLSSGMISLAIAWATVAYKSYRVARTNPIEPLRGE